MNFTMMLVARAKARRLTNGGAHGGAGDVPTYPHEVDVHGESALGNDRTFRMALSECGRWLRLRDGGCTWYMRTPDVERAMCMSLEPSPFAKPQPKA